MEEGVLSAWHKKEGDAVAVDDLLAEVETDKATMEFRAFDKGTLLKILVPAGRAGEARSARGHPRAPGRRHVGALAPDGRPQPAPTHPQPASRAPPPRPHDAAAPQRRADAATASQPRRNDRARRRSEGRR